MENMVHLLVVRAHVGGVIVQSHVINVRVRDSGWLRAPALTKKKRSRDGGPK